MIIDVTTTATLRPEVLRETYELFWKNFFSGCNPNYQFRLIINVDPIGDSAYCQEDVLNVAKDFFPRVCYNFPNHNSFPKAVKWVWSHTFYDYVFHLEDMWSSNTPTDLEKMIYILDNYPKIAYVNLNKGILTDQSPFPNYYEYQNKDDVRLFMQIDKPLLSPGLFRGKFVREFSKKMSDSDNPELQLWGDSKEPGDKGGSDSRKKYLSTWDYVIYMGNCALPFLPLANREVTMTRGRVWKKSHGIFKSTHFTPWEFEEKS